MEWNFFTVTSALIVLLPVGLATTASSYDNTAAVWRRMLAAMLAAVIAFGLLGAAVLQGDSDVLLAVDPSRLYFRSFDGASLHHCALAVMLAGVVACSLRGTSAVAAGLTAVPLAGLLFPILAKLIWFGPLRRIGTIDVGGATVLFALVGALTITLLRLTRERDEPARNAPLAVGVGGLMLVVGWCALLFTTGIMQSPATPAQGSLNVLRAVAAAGLVAMVSSMVLRKDQGPLRVLSAMHSAAVATAALAGRAPASSAVVTGLIAGVIAPPVVLAARRVFRTGPHGDFAIAAWLGSLAASLMAVPYARDPDEMHLQLVAQLAASALCTGTGICAGILLAPFVRLLSGRREPGDHPIAAS